MYKKKIIIDLLGTEPTEHELELLSHANVGGVILFQKNYNNKSQLISLINKIRNSVAKKLLIMVDHEGGRIWRFNNEEFTKINSARYFGELYEKDPSEAIKKSYQSGFIMAKELKECDLDLSLAPVLDIDGISEVIRDRAFHKNPEIIIKLAGSFINGMLDAGLMCCGKHFPGHGGCIADTHFQKAIDSRTFAEINKADLIPFAKISEKLSFILVSHVIYEKIDHRQAVYSKFWLQEVLRKKLNYKGSIISDCLSMKAANIGEYHLRVKTAIDAGCDFVILSQLNRNDLLFALNNLNSI